MGFPPSSGEKSRLQVALTQREAWGCPALNPRSKPQGWCIAHARAQRSCISPRNISSSLGIHRWKSSSAFAQGQCRGHSRLLYNREEAGRAVPGGAGTTSLLTLLHAAARCGEGRSSRLPWHGGLPPPSTPLSPLAPHTLYNPKKREKSQVFLLFPQLSDSRQWHRSDRGWGALPCARATSRRAASSQQDSPG